MNWLIIRLLSIFRPLVCNHSMKFQLLLFHPWIPEGQPSLLVLWVPVGPEHPEKHHVSQMTLYIFHDFVCFNMHGGLVVSSLEFPERRGLPCLLLYSLQDHPVENKSFIITVSQQQAVNESGQNNAWKKRHFGAPLKNKPEKHLHVKTMAILDKYIFSIIYIHYIIWMFSLFMGRFETFVVFSFRSSTRIINVLFKKVMFRY